MHNVICFPCFRGIKVSIKTSFEGTYYKESKLHYAFEYIVKIENQSKELVQLNSRHWNILDSLNDDETVDGEGVIGKKPVLKPGEVHTYSSGCLLASPYGAMYGFYRMINLNSTKKFNVVIPTFKLSAPFALN
jgi:ApaG protein